MISIVAHYCQQKTFFLPIKKVKNIIGPSLPTEKTIFFFGKFKKSKSAFGPLLPTEKNK